MQYIETITDNINVSLLFELMIVRQAKLMLLIQQKLISLTQFHKDNINL